MEPFIIAIIVVAVLVVVVSIFLLREKKTESPTKPVTVIVPPPVTTSSPPVILPTPVTTSSPPPPLPTPQQETKEEVVASGPASNGLTPDGVTVTTDGKTTILTDTNTGNVYKIGPDKEVIAKLSGLGYDILLGGGPNTYAIIPKGSTLRISQAIKDQVQVTATIDGKEYVLNDVRSVYDRENKVSYFVQMRADTATPLLAPSELYVQFQLPREIEEKAVIVSQSDLPGHKWITRYGIDEANCKLGEPVSPDKVEADCKADAQCEAFKKSGQKYRCLAPLKMQVERNDIYLK